MASSIHATCYTFAYDNQNCIAAIILPLANISGPVLYFGTDLIVCYNYNATLEALTFA